jgi:hypothetical protein
MKPGVVLIVLALAGCKKNAPPPEEPPPIKQITACEAYQHCCLLYAEQLSGIEGVPQELVDRIHEGCSNIQAIPDGQQACLTGLERLREGYPPLIELGFDVPQGCALESVEIVVPEAAPSPEEQPEPEPVDEERKWVELAAELAKRAAAEPNLLVGGATVTEAQNCGGALITLDTVLRSYKHAYKGDILVRKGKENSKAKPVATIQPDAEGTFSIELPPGTYCLIESSKKDPPPGKTTQYMDATCLETLWKSCDAVVKHPSGKPVLLDLVDPCSSPCYFGPPPPSAPPPPPL